jgi:hypothetical protein
MTVGFRDWLSEEKRKEIRRMVESQEFDECDIINYMEEAWNARYHTLTYHDL